MCKMVFKSLVCILFGLMFLSSCKNKKDYESKVVIFKNDKFIVNEKARIRIVSEKRSNRIINAYFDCLGEPVVDEDKEAIVGCDKEFVVKNDTIRIQFVPTKIGKGKFEDIRVLLKDDDGKYLVIDTTFYYEVILSDADSLAGPS